MMPLQARLRKRWPVCLIWSYRSWRQSLRDHASGLSQFLAEEVSGVERVHFVAHSMGSIVLRTMLATRPMPNLGNTVFLGPPHHGTPKADAFCRRFGERLRTIAELKSSDESFVNQLPPWNYGPACVIQADGDFLIPPKQTELEGITQYASVPGPHSFLLVSSKAATLAARFLETGRL